MRRRFREELFDRGDRSVVCPVGLRSLHVRRISRISLPRSNCQGDDLFGSIARRPVRLRQRSHRIGEPQGAFSAGAHHDGDARTSDPVDFLFPPLEVAFGGRTGSVGLLRCENSALPRPFVGLSAQHADREHDNWRRARGPPERVPTRDSLVMRWTPDRPRCYGAPIYRLPFEQGYAWTIFATRESHCKAQAGRCHT